MNVSVVIPAHNEAQFIADVVGRALAGGYDVIVVDDGSTDDTAVLAEKAGARVISQKNSGYIAAIKNGFVHSESEIVVTLDGDGEHPPEEIPRLLEPIIRDGADLVLGSRSHIPRASERLISSLCRSLVGVKDTGTGFRAMKRSLAVSLTFPGVCICGTSVLEAYRLGAKITEVPVASGTTTKPRKIAWKHAVQLLYVLKMVLADRITR